MAGLPGEGPDAGVMAAVFASAGRVAEAVGEQAAGLAVAADNGTHQVVSGLEAAVGELARHFSAEGVRVERLETSHAFHSALMDPVLEGLEAALEGVALAAPGSVRCERGDGGPGAGRCRTGVLRRQARAGDSRGRAELAGLGVGWVEIGPRWCWSLVACVLAGAKMRVPVPAVLASCGEAGTGTIRQGGGGAYEAGAELEFAGLFAGEERRRLGLPTYPFQRRRHWVGPRRRGARAGHPLLGQRRDSPGGEVTFETELLVTDPAWLGDHRVFGLAVAPGALHAALVLAAGAAANRESVGAAAVAVEDLRLHGPLVLPEGEASEDGPCRTVQVVAGRADDSGVREIEVFSRGGEGPWTLLAEGRVSLRAAASEGGADLAAIKARLAEVGAAEFYRMLDASEVTYGPAFRGVQAIWAGSGEALAEVVLVDGSAEAGLDVHPAQLDGCFQVLAAAAGSGGRGRGAVHLPLAWERLRVSRALPERVVCHARLRGWQPLQKADPETLTADLRLYSPSGAEIGEAHGFALKRATRVALLAAAEGVSELLYEVVWRERPHPGGRSAAGFLAKPAAVSAQLRSFLQYLADEEADPGSLSALQKGLERLAAGYALEGLERLGWRREPGAGADPERLSRELKVVADQERLFGRLFARLAGVGVLAEAPDGGWTVIQGRRRAAAGLPRIRNAGPSSRALRKGDRAAPARKMQGVAGRRAAGGQTRFRAVRRKGPARRRCTRRRRRCGRRTGSWGMPRRRWRQTCRRGGGCGCWRWGRAPAAQRRRCFRRCRRDGSTTYSPMFRRGSSRLRRSDSGRVVPRSSTGHWTSSRTRRARVARGTGTT